jgi:pantoate--beta-alanine ligase
VHLAITRNELAVAAPSKPGRRAVVTTLGALHEGHAANIRAARKLVGQDGCVVVTIFVNPLQFGTGEDFDRYPRTLEADLQLCEREGADVVFAPAVAELYPEGEPQVRLSAGPIGERYEGAFRPGHFDGVLTVVAKLLHLIRPDLAVFGQKDAQQLALIRRMVTDLDFAVEVVATDTAREPDGLAMASRNIYLSPQQRQDAVALPKALFAGLWAIGRGPEAVRGAAMAVLSGAHGVEVDYLALIDPSSFTDAASDHTGEAILAVAGRVGTTRLIDSMPLYFKGSNLSNR